MRNHSTRYSQTQQTANRLDESMYGLFNDMTYHSPNDIKGIRMVSTEDYTCKVKCDGRHVYANHRFRPGDVIELCPCRSIDKSALYAKDIREMVFEVRPGEEYVIPMGYCQYYNLTDQSNPEYNCDYEWDSRRKCILIRASEDVGKGDILTINISRE